MLQRDGARDRRVGGVLRRSRWLRAVDRWRGQPLAHFWRHPVKVRAADVIIIKLLGKTALAKTNTVHLNKLGFHRTAVGILCRERF